MADPFDSPPACCRDRTHLIVTVVEERMVLPVSPEQAFDLIGDPGNGSRIDPMIRSYRPEGGTMREGGTNHIRGRMFGLPYRAVSQTLVWDRPHRMVLQGVKPRRPVRMTLTQLFEHHPDGTLLVYRMEIEPTVPGGGIVVRLMRRFIARNFQRAVPRVRALIDENRH